MSSSTNNAFSEESRERAINSPEQMGTLLKITALPTYLLALTLMLLLGAFFVWGSLAPFQTRFIAAAWFSRLKAHLTFHCPTRV